MTFTATVTPDARSTGTPTGTVTFEEGTTVLGTVPLDNGVATFSIATLAVGSHTITAVYSGDADFATASGVTTETVNAPTTPPPATSAGPRLTGVKRYGYHAMPTTVVLTFDQPLDPGPPRTSGTMSSSIRAAIGSASTGRCSTRPASRSRCIPHSGSASTTPTS